MTTAVVSISPAKKFISTPLKQKESDNHKKAAEYLLAAATHHFKAAIHLDNGNNEKATQCSLLADDYLKLAKAARK